MSRNGTSTDILIEALTTDITDGHGKKN
jgi:hypothetical protein